MKRWTLLLFLLLLPFTMAPRTSMTPDPELLDVVLVVSRTDVSAGDRVNVVGQVTNVGDHIVQDPEVGILFGGDPAPKVTLLQSGKGCEGRGGGVHCTLRSLKPGQRGTFTFSMRLDGGDVVLTVGQLGIMQAPSSEPVPITVTTPATGDRG
jgi:hypothetical protein